MFGFMKKLSDKDKEEKERKRREKLEKEKKKNANASLTADELFRLEEAQQSLQLKSVASAIKSDIDSSNSMSATLSSDSGLQPNPIMNTNSATRSSLSSKPVKPLPPVQPKPKKGILKDKSSFYIQENETSVVKSSIGEKKTVEQVSVGENSSAKSVKNIISSFDKPTVSPKISSSSLKKSKPNLVTETPRSVRNLTSTFSQDNNNDFRQQSSSTPHQQIKQQPSFTSKMETNLVRSDSPTQKTYNNIHLKLPQLTNHPSIKSKQRKISLKRLQTGDFGFSLRKGLTVERGANPDGSDLWKTIIFAESSTKNIIETVFKPGDQIIEINNKNVENWNRDAIIDILKKSADEVIITVRTLPEFSDFQMTNCANEDEKSSLSADGNSSSGGGGKRVGRCMSIKYKMAKLQQDQQATPTTTTNSLSSSHQHQQQQQQRQQQQQQLWLIHKKGFSACYQADDHGSANSAEGKVNVKVESGQIIEVNEDDLEKANPAQYDCIEDLTALRYVNETSVMHVLRQRFHTNLVCTYAGYTTLAVNSLKPLSIYSDKVKEIFRTNLAEDTPPHVYSIAQSTFKSMMTSRKDHSVVALGDSGSGKSFQLDNILNYYVAACGAVNSILNAEKLGAIKVLMENFASCRSLSGGYNVNKCSQVFTLDFDQNGQIVSAGVQILMLEKSRVVKGRSNNRNNNNNNNNNNNYNNRVADDDDDVVVDDGESSTFNVFHNFLNGIEQASRKSLFLDKLYKGHPYFDFTSNNTNNNNTNNNVPDQDNNNNNSSSSNSNSNNQKSAQHNWSKVLTSFDILKFSKDEVKTIHQVLAAIYHLGASKLVKSNSRLQFENVESVERACSLLGTTLEELLKTLGTSGISRSSTSTPNSLSPSLRLQSSPNANSNSSMSNVSGDDILEGFIVGLYVELLNALVSLINRSMASNYRTTASIIIVDCPGFRSSINCGNSNDTASRSLDDLMTNYIQERLQLLFHDNVFNSICDLYDQENIGILFDYPDQHASVVAQMIDNPPQNLTRSPDNDRKLSSNRGLLWLLDEQSLMPSTTDESFLNELFIECSHYKVKEPLLLSTSSQHSFIINHMNGAKKVLYNVKGWLKSCQDITASVKNIGPFLIDSKRPEISDLFSQTCKSTATSGGGILGGSIVGLVGGQLGVAGDSTTSLRRVSSMKRTFATSGSSAVVKKRSMCLQIKFQMDTLIEMLKKTKVSFIHCIAPRQHHQQSSSISSSSDVTDSSNDVTSIDVPYLRQQLRSYSILPAVRLFKQGYPENIPFKDFKQKYDLLLPMPSSSASSHDVDDKKVVEGILEHLDIDQSSYVLGNTKVFFHSGILYQLEGLREARVSSWLIKLQAISRTYLTSKKLQKLKLQQLAVSCIQKNVRKLMFVRHWPWWKLYTKVKPVLNVLRTEEELKDKETEIEQLRQRVEKLEKEKHDYKQTADKLEIKLSEVMLELQEEHSNATQATDMLEVELNQRLLLEKEVKDLQTRYNSLQTQCQSMEMELMKVKVISATVMVDSDDDDRRDGDDLMGDSHQLYKERYEKLKRESEMSRKRMTMRMEEQQDEMDCLKKNLEKKLSEAVASADQQEKAANEMKRKLQRLTQEMADVKMHLEEQMSRNGELERKQKKFDAELAKVSESLKSEKMARDRLLRERDELISKNYALDQEVKNLRMDYDMQCQKLYKVEVEMTDLVSAGKDDKESIKSRQLKSELENKVKDLEEELDEQAGTIQQLEQAKLRLEMEKEKVRQQHSKELEEKENDLEELKRTFQKKFRNLEAQLEEEMEERQRCLRERREMERKVQMLAQEKPDRDKDVEQLLRRDLKRTKALLKDAQLMLDKYKEGAGNRQTMKQLRDQLEDAEFARTAALKAKKTMEAEVNELQEQLDHMSKSKNEIEEKCMSLTKEKNDLINKMDDYNEEMAELMKKYKAAVQQTSLEVMKFEEQSRLIEQLSQEREALRDEITLLQNRTQYFESSTVDKETIVRLEAKNRDLEAKLDFEAVNKKRVEAQLTRLKEQLDNEVEQNQSKRSEEVRSQEMVRMTTKKMKDVEEERDELRSKESEASRRKNELEKKVEELKIELDQAHSDLHLAFRRINELTSVMESDMIHDSSDGDEVDARDDDDDDDNSFHLLPADEDDDDDDDDDVMTSRSRKLHSEA